MSQFSKLSTMSMWSLLSLIILFNAKRVDAQWVTTVPTSAVDVEVSGNSTYFTLKTCSHAWIQLRSDTIDSLQFAIYINEYDFYGFGYYISSIKKTNENAVEASMTSYWEEFPICNASGSFWISWGGGWLKLGEGTLGSNVRMENLDFDEHVVHFTIGSGMVAEWHFSKATTTTVQPVTSPYSASSSRTETAAPATDTAVNSSDTELHAGRNSKSSATKSFCGFRMSTVLALCLIVGLINIS